MDSLDLGEGGTNHQSPIGMCTSWYSSVEGTALRGIVPGVRVPARKRIRRLLVLDPVAITSSA